MGRPDKQLRALLERRRDHLAENAGDLDDWTRALDALWDRIGGWLKPLVDDGLLRWVTLDHEVADDDCAPYRARAGVVTDMAGSWKVRFNPVARFVIGPVTGRVELACGMGKYVLYRHGTGDGARWEFANSREIPRGKPEIVWLERHHVIDALAEMLEPWTDVHRTLSGDEDDDDY